MSRNLKRRVNAGRVDALTRVRSEAMERSALEMANTMISFDFDLREYWTEYARQIEEFYSQVEKRCELLISEALRGE